MCTMSRSSPPADTKPPVPDTPPDPAGSPTGSISEGGPMAAVNAAAATQAAAGLAAVLAAQQLFMGAASSVNGEMNTNPNSNSNNNQQQQAAGQQYQQQQQQQQPPQSPEQFLAAIMAAHQLLMGAAANNRAGGVANGCLDFATLSNLLLLAGSGNPAASALTAAALTAAATTATSENSNGHLSSNHNHNHSTSHHTHHTHHSHHLHNHLQQPLTPQQQQQQQPPGTPEQQLLAAFLGAGSLGAAGGLGMGALGTALGVGVGPNNHQLVPEDLTIAGGIPDGADCEMQLDSHATAVAAAAAAADLASHLNLSLPSPLGGHNLGGHTLTSRSAPHVVVGGGGGGGGGGGTGAATGGHHNNHHNHHRHNNGSSNTNSNSNSNHHHHHHNNNNNNHHHHHHHHESVVSNYNHSSIQTQQQLLATKGFNPMAVPSGSGQQTEILTPTHLKKAKLMFFYVRYPNSSTLKDSFRDVRFNKNNTAQLVKWFSNFREFYYIQMEKYAREATADERIQSKDDICVPYDHELINTLNNHYNKNRHIALPEIFRQVVEETLKHFYDAIYHKRDQEQSWKKVIYKIINRLDQEVPEEFKTDAFSEHLE